MTEETKKMINIDGVDYAIDDLDEKTIKVINSLAKSNQIEADLSFEIEQLRVARQVLFDELKGLLPQKEEADEQSD